MIVVALVFTSSNVGTGSTALNGNEEEEDDANDDPGWSLYNFVADVLLVNASLVIEVIWKANTPVLVPNK